MLWLNFAATIIILGAIINAVVEEYLSKGEIKDRNRSLNKYVKKIKGKIKK